MHKLVVIHWEDSRQSNGAWRFLSDPKNHTAVECISVGWLIHDKDGVKALAQNFGDVKDEDMQVSGVIHIPDRCILEIEEICQGWASDSPCQ